MTTEINRVIDSFNALPLEEKEYVADMLAKQLIELRREEIARRAMEAEHNYNTGKVKKGNLRDLYEDLEND